MRIAKRQEENRAKLIDLLEYTNMLEALFRSHLIYGSFEDRHQSNLSGDQFDLTICA